MKATCYVRQDADTFTAITTDLRTWAKSRESADAALDALSVLLFGAAVHRWRHGLFQSRGQLCDRYVISTLKPETGASDGKKGKRSNGEAGQAGEAADEQQWRVERRGGVRRRR